MGNTFGVSGLRGKANESLTALRMLDIMAEKKVGLDVLASPLIRVPQEYIFVRITDKKADCPRKRHGKSHPHHGGSLHAGALPFYVFTAGGCPPAT